MGHYTSYARFMDELKNILPRGSQVTIETNTCWGGNMAEVLFENKYLECEKRPIF
jgi:hypothetical protein